MAYLDKNGTRELVNKHKDLFSKLANSGKGNLQEKIKKIVNQAYMIMLLLKSAIIGVLWWAFSLIDPFYGTFFLFVMAILGTKRALDNIFFEADSNLLEAIEEAGLFKENAELDEDGEEEKKEDSTGET